MWILEVNLVGTGLCLVGTVLFLVGTLGPFKGNRAIGLSAITGVTIHNPLSWITFVASLVIGCAIVRSWPVAAKV